MIMMSEFVGQCQDKAKNEHFLFYFFIFLQRKFYRYVIFSHGHFPDSCATGRKFPDII